MRVCACPNFCVCAYVRASVHVCDAHVHVTFLFLYSTYIVIKYKETLEFGFYLNTMMYLTVGLQCDKLKTEGVPICVHTLLLLYWSMYCVFISYPTVKYFDTKHIPT